MPAQPNVLFICTDQQYAGAMSCAGNGEIHTPAMDSLAAGGVRFENAYCTQPLCGPARTSFFTGLMPSAAGAPFNSDPIRPDCIPQMMGNLLSDAGYHCAYAGKWHVGGVSVQEAGSELLCGNGDDQVPELCARFFSRQHEKPFLLAASFVNPHDICQWARSQPLPQGPVQESPTAACPSLPANFAIPPFEPDFIRWVAEANTQIYPLRNAPPEHWRRYRDAYYRLTEKVDALVGKVLDALNEAGLEENTLVVFTSDHGDGHGAHQWNQKSIFYEEVLRVPFIIKYPGVTQAGTVDSCHLVSNGLDFLPTICDYAGATAPVHCRGRSLRPLLEGQEARGWTEQLVIESRLDFNTKSLSAAMDARCVRTNRYKYSVYPWGRHREQLVDLGADPGEMVNLAVNSNCRHILDEHRQRLLDWCQETGDSFLKQCVPVAQPVGR